MNSVETLLRATHKGMSKTILLLNICLSVIAPGCVLEQQAPPTPTIAEQEEDAFAIMNWLKTNNHHVTKDGYTYVISWGTDEITVSEGTGLVGWFLPSAEGQRNKGRVDRAGKSVTLYHSHEGTLRIQLYLLRENPDLSGRVTATFISDRKGNLRPVFKYPYSKSDKPSRQSKDKRRKSDVWIIAY